jgi:membrane protein DedA with SNARE-associated domain
MSLEEFISTFGYAAIGIGTFFEGETILVLGSFASHRGYLELPLVILSAFTGTFLGDQLFFYIGRFKGKQALENWPYWKSKSEKVFSLLENHRIWLILGFRFLYGLRTVTPFILGASRIPVYSYIILNFIGASIWAIAVGVSGYFFGNTLEILIGNIKKYEVLIFAAVAGAGLLLWIFHLLKRRSIHKKVN